MLLISVSGCRVNETNAWILSVTFTSPRMFMLSLIIGGLSRNSALYGLPGVGLMLFRPGELASIFIRARPLGSIKPGSIMAPAAAVFCPAAALASTTLGGIGLPLAS